MRTHCLTSMPTLSLWVVLVLGAADKAAIQRVEVPPCQLPDSGT
jgi:hypothetical protein